MTASVLSRTAPVVVARAVQLRYGSRTVLHDIDLDLAPDEQVVLTGRSGSGKTTLLLVLAGLLKPTSGTVTSPLGRRDVVYVPQAPSLVPELSALENTALSLRVRGVAPAEATGRALDALAELGVADAAAALPAELSGGMQQRVALARALVVGPPLLLADEPTGSLDRHTGAEVLAVLRASVARTGGALVVATHDREVADSLPRRVILRDGRVSEG